MPVAPRHTRTSWRAARDQLEAALRDAPKPDPARQLEYGLDDGGWYHADGHRCPRDCPHHYITGYSIGEAP